MTRAARAVAMAACVLVARSTTAGPIALDVDACLDADRADLERQVAIELEAIALEAIAPGEDAPLRARVSCDGETAIRVRLEDASGTVAERRIDARAPAPARARLIALVLSEMVATRVLTPDAPPVVETRILPPASASAPAPAPAPASARPGRWRGGLYVAARGFRRTSWVALGGGAALERDVGAWAGLAADLALEGRAVPVESGQAAVMLGSLGLAPAVHRRSGRATFSLAAGARAGLALLRGEPADGDVATGRTIAGWWAGPAIGARAWMRIGPLLASAGLEAGVVLRPVTGLVDGAPAVAVDGPWAAVTALLGAPL